MIQMTYESADYEKAKDKNLPDVLHNPLRRFLNGI